ncbi:WhiB family transcriptional regulator [Allosaccharopolyspora coralli]|uniref:Transcriptional regulator WhiB n=1 Tax=Allosaccharopolyspora coralli TaxID=2665642 RepID=A0A5Q3QGW2_9PSEU|nr:WhiB family transcriptional regulator [Allosaccharopolyspora coralli]QGK70699.1 WhiB family transcriptional regulator [Allosaccharopolyspora coralli]
MRTGQAGTGVPRNRASGKLPAPRTEHYDWQVHAACRSVDTEVFFHPENERGSARQRRENQAKQVCARCVVREECRAHALRVQEPYGVWGGLGEVERLRLT